MSEVFLNGKVELHCGDVRAVLGTLPSDHFDCVVTSPPYWGLRDYGVDGQLGLERSLGEHIAVMVDVFSDVRRILKPTGTLWLNYGDCYAANVNGRSAADTKAIGNDDRTFRDKPFNTVGPIYGGDGAGGYLKPKDLCGVPWRVAFALQESGWWLRQDIIWSKSNPMPESIKDRCTKSHEYLFLLTKSERYYFDHEAIKEPAAYIGLANQDESGFKNPGSFNGKHKDGYRSSPPRKRREGEPTRHGLNGAAACGISDVGEGRETRNKRSVWEIATAPFPEAHFATFPPALIEPCILAGSPENGIVLDPFGGAGTTGLVSSYLNRRCTLIELNPEYCCLARARIEAAYMGKDEGARHMAKSTGKIAHPGPLFAEQLEAAE